jgi:BED zinc finger
MADRKSSPVWDFFTVDTSNDSIAICNVCKYKLTRGNSAKQYSTSPMIQHLKAKHPAEYESYSASNAEKAKERQSAHAASNLPESSKVRSTSVNQLSIAHCLDRVKTWEIKSSEAMRIHKAIGRMIIKDLEPFRIVEREGVY